MKYEKPEITKVTTENERKTAMGPESCSTRWPGCCWKD